MIGVKLNDRYRLDKELGRGGLGVIYEAHDLLLDRRVAVKLLNSVNVGPESRVRLLNEARAAARLNHPNIVSIYDAGEFQPQGEVQIPLSYIVMELIDGESLHDFHTSSYSEIISLAKQISAALEHAHSNGIIHRDLKPENILITKEGLVKLTDFGLARSIATRFSLQGMIIGTVFYLAPELALGQPFDGRVDLYALGVVLYELITGQLPFNASDPVAVISQHLYSPPPPPGKIRADVPPALENLIIRLLSKKPEDRPSSATELIGLLDHALNLETGVILPPDISAPEQLQSGKLLGREREYFEARTLWQQVISGEGEEHILLLSGETGVGKTPLVKGIMALAEASRAKAILSECYPEGPAPYSPIAELIRQALSQPSLEFPPSILNDLILLVPDLAVYFPREESLPHPDVEVEQQRLFESFVDLCLALTKRSPLLLVVEDIQWSDGATLSLIRHLARRARVMPDQLRVMILLTYRESEMDEACCLQDVLIDFNRERLAVSISLERFNREQTKLVLMSMFNDEISAEFLDNIYRLTEGNLYFIEEVCKALVESGRLVRKDGHWNTALKLEDLQLPHSIRMAIQARLTRLSPPTQDVLRLAAVIGQEFEFDVLLKASEMDEDALINALEEAEEAQLIKEMKPGNRRGIKLGEVKFTFEHGLIPTTLRDGLSGLRRHKLHRKVEAAIAELHPNNFEALAYHSEQAGDEENAWRYMIQAGDRAISVFANREAERYYRLGLESQVPDHERAHLLAGLGEALFRLARYDDAVRTWEQAIQLGREVGDVEMVARLYARESRSAWYAGEPERSLSICLDAIKDIQRISTNNEKLKTPGMASLLHETARAYRFNNQIEEALPLCRQALEMAEELNLVDVQADAYATLGIMPNITPDEALEALNKAVKLSESAKLLAISVRAHENLSDYLRDEKGDLYSARDHHDQARLLCQKMGILDWEYDQLEKSTQISLLLGDIKNLEQGLASLRKMESDLNDPGRRAAWRKSIEAQYLFFLGKFDEAVPLLENLRAQAGRESNLDLLIIVSDLLAEAMLETGRLSEAETILTEVIRLGECRQTLIRIPALCLFGFLRVAQGRQKDAKRLLKQTRDLTSIRLPRADELRILWLEARLAAAEQHWTKAAAVYERALRLAEEMEMRWYQGCLLTEMAESWLTRSEQGAHERARRLYIRALETYETLDALPQVLQIQAVLKNL
jgi:eukaryotic-like serine/threonine-protein kinase